MTAIISTAPSLKDFSDLIKELYASLNDNQGFDNFLLALKKRFSCNAASLIAVQDEPRMAQYGWTVGIPEKYMRWYIEQNKIADDSLYDLVLDFSSKSSGFVCSSSILGEIPLTDAIGPEFKPWLEDVSMVDTCGMAIPVDEGQRIFLALQRDSANGVFSERDMEELNLLNNHIQQAVQLFIQFYHRQADSDSLKAAIDCLPKATIVVNEFLEVVQINRSAEDLLHKSDGFSIQENKLQLHHEEAHHKFMYEAWDMARGLEAPDDELGQAIVMPSGNNTPITVTMTPLFSSVIGGSSKGIMVQFYDPSHTIVPSADRIRQIFGLTKAQSCICELLLEGMLPKEIAANLGISSNTVREHLRLIYKKTGYRTQSELISAMLRTVF